MRHLRFEVDKGVATALIDRPQARNALSFQTMRELDEALVAVAKTDARVLVVRGAGDRAFCAGGDLKELEAIRDKKDARAMAKSMRATLDRIPALPIPVLAAVNGDALGGGAELAIACDFRIAAQRARIGFAQIRLGLSPAWGASERLAALVGRGRALYALTLGHNMTAREAMALGLVEEVVADEEFDAHIERVAAVIASAPPAALAGIKAAVNSVAPHRHPDQAAKAIATFVETWVDPAHWEAVERNERARKQR